MGERRHRSRLRRFRAMERHAQVLGDDGWCVVCGLSSALGNHTYEMPFARVTLPGFETVTGNNTAT